MTSRHARSALSSLTWLVVFLSAAGVVVKFPHVFGVITGREVALSPPAEGGMFYFSIFLNFWAVVLFCGLNYVAVKQLSLDHVKAWYRAWLCWALVYASYVLVLFLFSLPAHAVGVIVNVAVPAFSIANNSFFLLVALHVLEWRSRSIRYRVALASGVLCLLLFLGLSWGSFRLGLGDAGPRFVDSAFSAFVALLLGGSFFRVLGKRSATISRFELFGSVISRLIVGCFFVCLAVHQLLVSLWSSIKPLEELFWLFSLITKIGLMGIFYMVVLLDRYLEEGEVGAVVFNRIEQGVFAIDEKWHIINVNRAAAESVGLQSGLMVGRDMKEVFFRSLFEFERFSCELDSEGFLGARVMLTKLYSGDDVKEFKDIHRLVGGQLVGKKGRDRIYALVYTAPADGAQNSVSPLS